MFKIRGKAFCLLIALAVSFAFAAGSRSEAKQGDTAAVVDGVVIPMSKLDAAIHFYKMAAVSTGRGVSPGEESKKREEMLERLIVDQLLYAEAARRRIKISEKEIDKALEEFKKRYRIKTDKEFNGLLERIDKSPKELRDDTKKQLMRYKLLSTEVAPKAKVSDQEAKKFYDDNVKKLFTRPKRVRISQIFMMIPQGASYRDKTKVKSELEEIRNKIIKGESFAKMAKRYSQDPSAKDGGDLGLFTAEELARELTSVVFSMRKNQLSKVLDTSRGYHLIKITDVENARTIPFDEVKVQIVRHLEVKKWAETMDHFLKGLMAKAKIKRNP